MKIILHNVILFDNKYVKSRYKVTALDFSWQKDSDSKAVQLWEYVGQLRKTK